MACLKRLLIGMNMEEVKKFIVYAPFTSSAGRYGVAFYT